MPCYAQQSPFQLNVSQLTLQELPLQLNVSHPTLLRYTTLKVLTLS